MKIGYPCINTSIDCTANRTFRLASYTKQKLIEKVNENLQCLQKILIWNKKNNLLFFRIGSQLVPFASHPICKYDWAKHFKTEFKSIGNYIKKNKMRISMHPDQFVLLNSPRKKVTNNSIKELEYHCKVLDLLGLDKTAKVQIHTGGVYGDKASAIQRFVEKYKKLSITVKKRLVIENDHVSYSLKDCLEIHEQTKIPILFDNLHHEILNNGEQMRSALKTAMDTWRKKDGIPMADYSEQKKNASTGAHTHNINIKKFKEFLKKTKGLDFDIMLEIKDKEKSALKAITALNSN